MKASVAQDMSGRWGLWLNFASGAGELIYSNFDYKIMKNVLRMVNALIARNAPGWRLP